ncbi:MAG TPA: proteobacterial dedicated sortase system response regulator [Gammaproteobacteria bacterium]|jgi:two-component system OmpR family response regulator
MSTNAARTVAVVEDETAIRENYADALRRLGYRVRAFAGRREAMAAFADQLPDLVIIDINLGHEVEGGFDLCRELRARSASLPIIFLTARDSELDAVSGLRLGADDYLTKNISLDHLMARVAALFRRVDALEAAPAQEETLERGDLMLDAARLMARWKGESVPLTVTEFWVVHSLAEHPGHVRNRDQLMAAASTVLDDSSVTSQIKRIRAKFTALDPDFAEIETVYGMGYRWVASTSAN